MEESRARESSASTVEAQAETEELKIDDDFESSADESDIDEKLEGRAASCNLSVQNIKSIIHHVLKDKRVINLAKKMAEEEETDSDDIVVYEPKLTRSRVRQAVATSIVEKGVTPEKLACRQGPVLPSPTKLPHLKHVPRSLLDVTFSEESSDDEYTPSNDVTKDTEDTVSEDNNQDSDKEGLSTEGEGLSDRGEEVEGATDTKDIVEDSDDDETDKEMECNDDHTSTDTTPKAKHHPPTPKQTTGVDQTSPSNAALSTVTTPDATACTTTHAVTSGSPTTCGESEDKLVHEAASLLVSLSDTILSSPIKPLVQRPITDSVCTSGSATDGVCTTDAACTDSICTTDAVCTDGICTTDGVCTDAICTADAVGTDGICTTDAVDTATVDEIGEIAHRTRSKFPLIDTTIEDIEASFNPPDAIPDDDAITPKVVSEIDEDEKEWQKWLADLMDPQYSSHTQEPDDQDDDTEYNFWSDQPEDEKEEFRNDKAVKIPQREVDELIEELLNPNSGIFNTDVNPVTLPLSTDATAAQQGQTVRDTSVPPNVSSGVDLTSAFLLESLGLQLPVISHSTCTSQTCSPDKRKQARKQEEEEVVQEDGRSFLTVAQSLQLWEQIQQHFQLLMQTFVLTRFEPSLVFMSQIAAQAIDEITKWCVDAQNGVGNTLWFVPGLEESQELLRLYNPHDESVGLTSTTTTLKLPDIVQDLIMNNGIFWQYPQLLPEAGLSGIETSPAQSKFSASEDYLLAMGMDHYGSSSWLMIKERLIPTKTTKQLQLRVKNLSSARSKTDNVVKHFKRTGKLREPSEELSVTCDGRLPEWILNYHSKRVESEKEETKIQEQVKSSTDVLSKPIKRNLMKEMKAVDNVAKKRKKETPPRRRKKASAQGSPKKGASPLKKKRATVSSNADYEQLIYMAGLEAADPAARYAYNYLIEVKAAVMDSPGVYDKFLQSLLQARKKNTMPSVLYGEVKQILGNWPHLLQLFMAFLEPKEVAKAEVLAEKIEFEQIKAFVQALEHKYSDAPLELKSIIMSMKNLQYLREDLTRQRVLNNLAPLMRTHEELLDELHCFVHGHIQRSTVSSSQDFEEVNLASIDEADDYETVTMLCDTTATTASATTTSSAVSTSGLVDDTNNADTTRATSLEENMSFSDTVTFAPDNPKKRGKTWSREQDALILQCCYDRKEDDLVAAIANVSDQVNRTVDEVKSRYDELLTLFKAMN